MSNVILGIDIGSTKICSIIAEIKDGVPYVIGSGIHKSEGIKKGSITNIEQASQAIRTSVNDAKRVAGTNVEEAIISISGTYTKSQWVTAVANIPNNEIGMKEITRVMQTAIHNASIPEDETIIHALPYEFKIDDRSSAEDPLGMCASRLEAFVHVVTAKKSAIENLKKAVLSSGIKIKNIILSAYASSIAVLSNEEKELGVACIDMGGQTCDLMIHSGYSMRYSNSCEVGSNNITVDLATALNTNQSIAEQIKIEYGKLVLSEEDKEKALAVPTILGNLQETQVNFDVIHSVISARVEELIGFLADSIEASGLKNQLGAGIILTGGMTNLDGIEEFATSIFRKPVRIAKPVTIGGLVDGLKSIHSATAIGLVLHGAGHYANYEMDYDKRILCKKPITNTNSVESSLNNVSDLDIKSHPNIVHKDDLSQIITKDEDKTNNIFSRFYKWVSQLF